MFVHTYDFAVNFPEIGDFRLYVLYFKNASSKRTLSDRLKFNGKKKLAFAPKCPLPRCR